MYSLTMSPRVSSSVRLCYNVLGRLGGGVAVSSRNSLLTFHNCSWNLFFNAFYKRLTSTRHFLRGPSGGIPQTPPSLPCSLSVSLQYFTTLLYLWTGRVWQSNTRCRPGGLSSWPKRKKKQTATKKALYRHCTKVQLCDAVVATAVEAAGKVYLHAQYSLQQRLGGNWQGDWTETV